MIIPVRFSFLSFFLFLIVGFPGGSAVKTAMQELQETLVWSWGLENPLEEEMATHCTIFSGKIPWIEELDGLQSMGSGLRELDMTEQLST